MAAGGAAAINAWQGCEEDLAELPADMAVPLTEEKPAVVDQETKRPLLEELWVSVVDLLAPAAALAWLLDVI